MKGRDPRIIGLQEKLALLQKEANELKITIAEAQRTLSDRFAQIDMIIEELEILDANTVQVVITDHAIVRFLERVKGIDRKQVENEILTPEILRLINQLGGNGTYPGKDGFSVCMKNGVVKTIKINR